MKSLPRHFKIILLGTILTLFSAHGVIAGNLSCSVTTAAACTETVVYRMSSTSNAHAELPSQSTAAYDNEVICCQNVIGLNNTCSGTFGVALKLSSTTNAHVEQNDHSNYANNACLSVPTGGSVTVAYQATDCTGYDTLLGSLSSTSNAHVGDASAYTTKICATASGVPQTLSFSISDNSIGFGNITPVQARYATGDTFGSTTDTTSAHTISIATNASSGYAVTITGTTLTSGGSSIDAIGASAQASSVGTEQFGARLTVDSGTGSSVSPYNSADWAFDTAAFPDLIATGLGDEVTTVFGARYIGNAATLTEFGSYSAQITYTVTATF